MGDNVDEATKSDALAERAPAKTTKSGAGRRKAASGKRKATTFVIDDRAAEILDSLMEQLGATTRSQVLQKALILTKVAADSAQKSHVVTISGDDENDKKSIILNA